MVTAHPAFNQLQVCRIRDRISNRHLMSPPEAFQSFAVQLFWAGPSFGSSHHDHRPSWAGRTRGGAPSRVHLNLPNLDYATLKRSSHHLMHCLRLVTLYDVWFVSIPAKQTLQLSFSNTCQDGWIRNLIAIEMEYRQYCAVSNRIEKFVRVPRCRHWSGFGFAVTNYGYCD